eukprot:Protomagalhaensia_sp_Gyna_25__1674@NODE_1873_length_1458_cov_121_541931_g1541_i0_p3_GENE_NODE_1873_length_1458_cov_121_541931_g1541_i0NODE_1873_length_1458_cov_121_541931_g1541_i0_p3_ORF_typecomplete_len144_score8_78_NODE_1873_length_1458_cov_121_541931_g1541_i0402833
MVAASSLSNSADLVGRLANCCGGPSSCPGNTARRGFHNASCRCRALLRGRPRRRGFPPFLLLSLAVAFQLGDGDPDVPDACGDELNSNSGYSAASPPGDRTVFVKTFEADPPVFRREETERCNGSGPLDDGAAKTPPAVCFLL